MFIIAAVVIGFAAAISAEWTIGGEMGIYPLIWDQRMYFFYHHQVGILLSAPLAS